MLPLTMISSLLLLLLGFVGTSVNGYTISRTQEYPSYSSASSPSQTFSSLKEAQESLASSNYAPVSSQRQYSTLYGGHSSPSFNTDSSQQSNSYSGHSASPDALNGLSSAYQNDAADLGSSYSPQGLDYTSANSGQHSSSPSVTYSGYSNGQSDQLTGLDYASSAPVSTSYTSAGPGSSYGGASPSYTSSNPSYTSSNSGSSYSSANPVSASYTASAPVSSSYSSSAPVSGSYSSSAPVSGSYSASGPVSGSYSHSSPVAASYATSGYKGHAPFTSTSTISFGHQNSAGHAPFSSHYPSETPQSSYADSPRYPASLKNFMNAAVHRESSGAYFARPSSSSSGGSHGPNYIHSPSSFTKSSYFGGGGAGFPKSGGKIIIVKDGHAMMHPESSYSGSMSFPAGSNYKVRNAGPFSSGHHYQGSASSYSHPSVYSGGPGAGSHPGAASSPYFQY